VSQSLCTESKRTKLTFCSSQTGSSRELGQFRSRLGDTSTHSEYYSRILSRTRYHPTREFVELSHFTFSANRFPFRSESEIAWIGSFQIAAVLFTAVISGKAFDAGYVKHLMVIGLLIYTAGLFGLSYATSYAEIFLAQGVACGVSLETPSEVHSTIVR